MAAVADKIVRCIPILDDVQSFVNLLIIRQKEPNNLETPVDRVDSFLTPTELFYVRSHFLRVLLERAGLEEDACEIVLEGPDRGIPKEGAIPPGPISYARSLPRAKALQREVLIAYQMNGRDPSQDHAGLARRGSRQTRIG